jgi:hypothetical protein
MESEWTVVTSKRAQVKRENAEARRVAARRERKRRQEAPGSCTTVAIRKAIEYRRQNKEARDAWYEAGFCDNSGCCCPCCGS